uniref:Uncharacterized protein n=1 Tax=Klebsiella phage vB_KpnM_Iguana_ER37 TaxID=3076781 RepID=A0AB38Z3A6_9CAUD
MCCDSLKTLVGRRSRNIREIPLSPHPMQCLSFRFATLATSIPNGESPAINVLWSRVVESNHLCILHRTYVAGIFSGLDGPRG